MPFGLRKSGKKVLVVNKTTGRVLGRHTSQAGANKQLAALAVRQVDETKRKK